MVIYSHSCKDFHHQTWHPIDLGWLYVEFWVSLAIIICGMLASPRGLAASAAWPRKSRGTRLNHGWVWRKGNKENDSRESQGSKRKAEKMNTFQRFGRSGVLRLTSKSTWQRRETKPQLAEDVGGDFGNGWKSKDALLSTCMSSQVDSEQDTNGDCNGYNEEPEAHHRPDTHDALIRGMA